ncbi:hypothetical protein GGX14DRAFT_563706 [Mycena pura]|uniref:Uncharacterized protein n=1 Tax=Mycena pura TaxID=153505 RepID=A0AAD6VLR9_9AGAR|nr:hypothetical protein GGX14DRAFT_563706 [Mycena pura]
MPKLTLAVVCVALITKSYARSGSIPYFSAAALYPRDVNSTSSSTPSTNFTFTTPTMTDQDESTLTDWISVVCLRPDQITKDQCDIEGVGTWIRCPNSDVSGILVRVSAYLANLLLGIIVMYDSKEASQAVWTQLVTVYSLLISASIAIGTNGLSRFHSEMTVLLVLSPLSSTLIVYAWLSFWPWFMFHLVKILGPRREHLPHRECLPRGERLFRGEPRVKILGPRRKRLLHRERLPRRERLFGGKPLQCLLVLTFATAASGFLVFTTLVDNSHFTAASPCDPLANRAVGIAVLYDLISLPYFAVPLVILALFPIFEETGASNSTAMAVVIGSVAPVILVVAALIYAVIKSRYELTKRVRHRMRNINIHGVSNFRVLWLMFWAYRDAFERRYPFLHFCGVFLVPMMYWVLLNELQLWATPDNIFTPSFGQVLALFVILPPLVQVLMLIPKAYRRWFRNLTVIRLVTQRELEPLDLPEGNYRITRVHSCHF